jgi:hypothetical protein
MKKQFANQRTTLRLRARFLSITRQAVSTICAVISFGSIVKREPSRIHSVARTEVPSLLAHRQNRAAGSFGDLLVGQGFEQLNVL